ncbi:metal ABC transporter ATP-binding protein [Caldilinea sp.]|uniref:metal ABC transporter ATP-binding protein n=1 Tax=Caldilinea sp. TaxID=2293560 RepID=UPI002C0A8C94|nr:metal ABC transporter ATP-binding protein [Anaerolineales bacterium]HQY94621.1 metal ABC transporter ATP-binding protein [Caldilinea sp.]
MQPLVEVRNLTFGYDAMPVLHDVSLHLHSGQFAGLVGPSGAGKTSLLKLVLGVLRPTHGVALLDGEPIDGRQAGRVGYVPQLETVDWNFPVTVEQVVLMGRVRRSGWWPWHDAAARREAHAVLERLEIDHLAARHIRALSGGQQQRVFLARALIARPDLLVLDEPTSGVDIRTAENILHLLAELNQQGMTILMTTHDLNAAAAHVPWLVCLNRQVIAEGPPEEIFTDEVLSRTYQSEMMVIRQEGVLLVAQKPHPHTHRDILPAPVLGHRGTTLGSKDMADETSAIRAEANETSALRVGKGKALHAVAD